MDAASQIVTIDGPAGAGKTTLAKALARRLGWTYLDTGAMYRAVGLAAHEAGADVDDPQALAPVVAGLKLTVSPGAQATRVFLDGREVTDLLRAPHISDLASRASAHQVVREALVTLQREIGARGKIVAEGRDMGTVVFPQAGVKFFLSADNKERARRRYLELREKGVPVTEENVFQDMEKRDRADSTRTLAPLIPAPEAVTINSTKLTPEEVLELMIKTTEEKFRLLTNK